MKTGWAIVFHLLLLVQTNRDALTISFFFLDRSRLADEQCTFRLQPENTCQATCFLKNALAEQRPDGDQPAELKTSGERVVYLFHIYSSPLTPAVANCRSIYPRRPVYGSECAGFTFRIEHPPNLPSMPTYRTHLYVSPLTKKLT